MRIKESYGMSILIVFGVLFIIMGILFLFDTKSRDMSLKVILMGIGMIVISVLRNSQIRK